MKKVLSLIAGLAVIVTVTACGKSGASSDPVPVQPTSSATQQTTAVPTADGQKAPDDHGRSTDDIESAIPGILYQLNVKENEEPVIKAVSLVGNRTGSARGYEDASINDKKPSVNDIRYIFELNEWISVILSTEKKSGLTAYIVEHQKDPQTYVDSFIASLDDSVPRTELVKPEDDNEYVYWGEFYVSPDDHAPGYYDLVFADGIKPVAKITLKLFKADELSDKSDGELEKIMKNEAVPIDS